MKTPVLQMKNICKSFGGLRALIDVNLELYPDEILAIVGDNGAGKSTLIKVLTGVYQADSGSTELNGQPANIRSRQDSLNAGIATVYQNLGLVDTLPAAPNIFLGDEPTKKILGLPFIDNKKMRQDAEEILRTKVGVELPNLDDPTRNFSGGQRQAVAIARAVRANDLHVLIMDEPTAALGPEETRKTLELIKTVRGRGTPIILISHNLDHVFSVADRVQVMRGGRRAGVVEVAQSNKKEVLGLIVGSDLQEAS
ncbi:Galactose/methyl galactoside import ATP-binding protein MglA [Labrenzia sp. THAF82]|uniref:ATP-binding cassette domain-containing protein n=1 Tax=Labrenzia sp. THAF82 TaxID=2587861 RepID=UPI0012A8B717|nr:ATP-binding cassette domain-containing protein [Labrenzia sp. THAF82]QFT34081.1 Galactose/methyl galactoside import ATP-binding protein MglA [Labrenzia sp. THAF82]